VTTLTSCPAARAAQANGTTGRKCPRPGGVPNRILTVSRIGPGRAAPGCGPAEPPAAGPHGARLLVRPAARLYLAGMIHRVGAKGQVVIPKDLRDRVGLHPGMAVDFALENERIVLLPRRSGSRLGGRFAGSGMAARLLQDRGAEPR
jgi:AbrB family looped-hinge helix DNA binding protein